MGGQRGTIRLALAFGALLASLSLVVWRQSRALETLGRLEAVRTERAIVESEKAALERRLLVLTSRSRVVEAARTRLDMRVPRGSEIVFLPAPGGGE